MIFYDAFDNLIAGTMLITGKYIVKTQLTGCHCISYQMAWLSLNYHEITLILNPTSISSNSISTFCDQFRGLGLLLIWKICKVTYRWWISIYYGSADSDSGMNGHVDLETVPVLVIPKKLSLNSYLAKSRSYTLSISVVKSFFLFFLVYGSVVTQTFETIGRLRVCEFNEFWIMT